jgi:hypothetical protein
VLHPYPWQRDIGTHALATRPYVNVGTRAGLIQPGHINVLGRRRDLRGVGDHLGERRMIRQQHSSSNWGGVPQALDNKRIAMARDHLTNLFAAATGHSTPDGAPA